MAQYASLLAGFPTTIPAFSVDSQCSGGLKSIEIAHNTLLANASSLIIAGGCESKSLAPTKFYHKNDERANKLDLEYKIANFSPDQISETPLINAAKNVAELFEISKSEMQNWYVKSHQKATECIGRLYI
jgi:acetyl-CoA C-acetyltransferase